MQGCYPEEVAGQLSWHGLLISPESGFVEVLSISEVLQGLNVCWGVLVEYSVGVDVVDVWLFDVDNFTYFVARSNEVGTEQKVCTTTIGENKVAARIE